MEVTAGSNPSVGNPARAVLHALQLQPKRMNPCNPANLSPGEAATACRPQPQPIRDSHRYTDRNRPKATSLARAQNVRTALLVYVLLLHCPFSLSSISLVKVTDRREANDTPTHLQQGREAPFPMSPAQGHSHHQLHKVHENFFYKVPALPFCFLGLAAGSKLWSPAQYADISHL